MDRKNFLILVLLAMVSFPITGCGDDDDHGNGDNGRIGNPITPSNNTPQAAPPFAGGVQLVGMMASGLGYAQWYGNFNGIQNIGDWNGAQYNLFVTGPGGRIRKYVTEHANSVPNVQGQDMPGTLLRDIEFGDQVKAELRLIKRGERDYTQITYPNRDNRDLFRLEPSNLKLDGNFTVGPRPSIQGLVGAADLFRHPIGAFVQLIEQAVAQAPKPRTCLVPIGQTDCEAK